VRPDNDTSSPGSGSEPYCQTAPDSLHRVELQRPRCRDRSACPRRTHSFPQVAQLVGPNDDVRIPRGSTKLDREVELGVVISRRTSSRLCGKCVRRDCRLHGRDDVSERAFQIERGGQWSKGKSAETFNPAGPWLVMPDEIDDVRDLRMWR
jgi:hypothetical protein